jgi:hypothetical protein
MNSSPKFIHLSLHYSHDQKNNHTFWVWIFYQFTEVVKHLHNKFEGQQGIWSNYVENHLIPRLNGFEIWMASYATAHLKLDILIIETGFKPT